ncbi:MAG: hypothetical protein K6E73_01075 [Bacteroidales bacterium]|nr:hypothetical protein [Bacteroidales bacterium]
MAKVTPISLVANLSGKLSQNDDTYFATNRQTGRVRAVRMKNGTIFVPTPAQLEAQAKFSSRARNTSAWLSANAPTDELPKGTELFQKVLAAYKAQHKIGTIFGYVASRMNDDGTLSIG